MNKDTSSFYNLINYTQWVKTKHDKHLKVYSDAEQNLKKRYTCVKKEIYDKIGLLSFMGALKNILFIKLRLKSIKLAKELFIINIEEGIPVHIPGELKIANLP